MREQCVDNFDKGVFCPSNYLKAYKNMSMTVNFMRPSTCTAPKRLSFFWNQNISEMSNEKIVYAGLTFKLLTS